MHPASRAPRALMLVPVLALALAACGDDPKPDQAAPEVTITAPTAGERVSDPIIVSGTVKDPKVKGRKTSGVTTVTVDGVEATLADGGFSATLVDVSPGPRTIVVAATDKAGNVGQATVDVNVGPPITDLLVEPPIASINALDGGVQLRTTGFFAGSGSSDLTTGTAGLTFESEDPTVAVVSASGVVTAASAEASGSTTITVRYNGLSATAIAHVAIDTEPPGRPVVTGYFPETNQRDQTWTGKTEPQATLTITGSAAAEPIVTSADVTGRFWVNVPLDPNHDHAIRVAIADTHDNTSTWDFPVLQSDGFVDGGTLHLSSSRNLTGFVGELVPEPLRARAYDSSGAPLAGAEVTFEVYSGFGALSVDGVGGDEVTKLVVKTDGAGYAEARWRLGPSDLERVEVHASLAGDVGFPVVFNAEGFMHLSEPTAIEGVVYDENRVPVVGLPVTVLAPGTEYAATTQGSAGTTDERGRFRIYYAPTLAEPTGPIAQHVRLDGTTMAPQKYVRIDRKVTVLPGQINDVGTFWVPRLPEGLAPKLDGNGVVTEELVLEREVIPGNGPVRVRVPVGTKITWPGGVPDDAKKLTLLSIPEIRAPMSLPDGFFSREVLALQPGGTRFEPPLPLDMPNSGGEPPGAALTMWSYDHFQSQFVPIGRGIVSEDGTRVVSEPGSGIRVGAWHKVSPPTPDPPCTATGQTKTTVIKGTPPEKAKKKYEKCVCYIEGTDQPTPCPEDKDKDGTPDKFIITNVGGCKPTPPPPPKPDEPKPKPPPPPPPPKKIEIVCEVKPLRITAPSDAKTLIKKGDTVQLKAECLDNHKSDGSIKWQRSAPDPKSGTGPTFTLKFDKEGTYVISASNNTKTCKGNDQRTVEVKSCQDMGVVRVCGDKIEAFGNPADGRYKVSGNVTAGLKGSGAAPGSTTGDSGDQYLKIRGDMLVDAAIAKPVKPTTVELEVGYPLVGPKMTPVVYQADFEITSAGVVTVKGTNDAEGAPFTLMEFALQFNDFQMLPHGLFIKNPYLNMFGRKQAYTTYTCPKPKVPDALDPVYIDEYHPPKCKPEEFVGKDSVKAKDLQIVVDGLEVSRDRILPTGYFEYKPTNAVGDPGLDLGTPLVKLMSLKAGYQKERFSGELGLQLNLKRFDLGIKVATVWGPGNFFSVDLSTTFSGFNLGGFELPGIPIIPAFFGAPVYLSSLGLGYESTSWPVSETEVVKLTGRAGVTLGPTLTLLSKKVALAKGDITLTLTSLPLAFSLKGDLTALAATDVSLDSAKTTSLVKLSGSLDVAFEPQFSVSGGIDLAMYVPTIPGLSNKQITSATTDLAIADAYLNGGVKLGLTVLADDGSLKGTFLGTVSAQIPKTKFTPLVKIANASVGGIYMTRNNTLELTASASQRCGIYLCTVSTVYDPANGLSIWLQTDAGDFLLIYGPHPNLRQRQVMAPSIGVSRESPALVTYEGAPASFELLEPGEQMIVTVIKPSADAVIGDLILPDGTRVGPVADPGAFAARSGVDFDAAEDGLSAAWTIYDPTPGTFTYVGPNDQNVVTRIHAMLTAPTATVTFDEPFTADAGDDLTVGWHGAGGAPDASVTFLATRLDGTSDEGAVELATFPLVAASAFTIDEAELVRGTYRIAARIESQGMTTYAQSLGTYTIGEPLEAEVDAPSLIEVADADDGSGGLEVSFLPGEGAARHVVAVKDDLGETLATRIVQAPGNRVVLPLPADNRVTSRGGGTVIVQAQREAGVATDTAMAERELTVRADAILLEPPRAVRVDGTWRWDVADGAPTERTFPVTIVEGPGGLAVDGDGVVTWTPTAADLGARHFVVRVGRAPFTQERSFDVVVIAAEDAVAPTFLQPVEGRVIAGGFEAPVSFSAAASGLGPVSLTLVSAPEGATLDGDVVTWQATPADAIAGRGEVAIVVRAEADGLASEARWVVRFADRDGDGLDDRWEEASGTDPDQADSGNADGDGDGLPDRAEVLLRTRGDVADSDADGIEDGDEASFTPPATFTKSSDPRLADADGDGVGDGDEKLAGTDVDAADSDGDGVSDADERARGTDSESAADGDGDGLADDREAVIGSDPTLADTDGDGLSDGDEVLGLVQNGRRCTEHTDPLRADGDGDGADDGAEARRCDGVTDPNDPGVDLDDDGLRSDMERLLGTLDTREDTDGDGVLDAVEVAAGSDPATADSTIEGVETEPDQPIATTGLSAELNMAPEALTDFGEILVFPDADHDGAPDEYEETYQYDPESPADAYDDADQDFLPMWREAQLGTNPRVADSDGDGVADGAELQDGTDPNDATSVSNNGPVTSLVLYPRHAAIEGHAFIGPGRTQLKLVGTRADQSEVDLTATSRGTTYTVDPPGAGTIDAAGAFTQTSGFAGEATVTARNLALSATATLTLDVFVPGPVSSLPLPGAPSAIALVPGVVYIGGAWGLEVVDVSAVESPTERGTVSLGGAPVALTADGTWVVAAMGAAGVAVVDVADADLPRVVAQIPLGAEARGIAWANERVVVATDKGLVRLEPRAGIGLVDTDGDGKDDRIVDVQAQSSAFTDVSNDLDRVVGARADGHLMAWRIVSEGLIQELDLSPGTTGDKVHLQGGVVSAATTDAGARLVLGSQSAWTRSAPLGLVKYTTQVPSFVLATESTSGTVNFLDARGAGPMTTLGNVDFDAFFPAGIVADQRYFYLADAYNNRLQIGTHNPLNDLLGIPPTVVPVSPLAGRTIEEGTRIDLEVLAKDDVGVQDVTITRDGEDVRSAAKPPWTLSVKTANVTAPTTMEIGAYATDYGGNVGAMAPLTFNVTPVEDAVDPTITLLEPAPEEWVAADSKVLVAVRPEDDHAIWKVEIRLDGALVATLEDAPYATEITMPTSSPSGRLALEVKAYDYGENSASATASLIFAGVDLVAQGVTRIAPDDGTWDGQDILIRRGTVAIDGAHTFGKVRVGRDGILTHSDVSTASDAFGLDLTTERVDVAPTGAIDVAGRGYLGDCNGGACGGGGYGPGNVQPGRVGFAGGVHGGVGAGGNNAVYGDWSAPTTHGAGGNYGSGGGEPGGDGGGRVRLTADAMVIDGVVTANGGNAPNVNQKNGGGGAGGSIWITTGTLDGVGRIEANGGSGGSNYGLPGGGGRVRIEIGGDHDFDLDFVRAYGGGGANPAKAGAGTVYRQVDGASELVIDDGNRSGGVDDPVFGLEVSDTPLVVPDLIVSGSARVVVGRPLTADRIVVEQNARISPFETTVAGERRLAITVDELTVDVGAALDMSGRGYFGDCHGGACGGGPYGPGNVQGGRAAMSGGAHGGSSLHGAYGDWLAPTTLGMGGNYGAGGGEPGGDGGGALRLIVTGTLTLDGTITADGEAPPAVAQLNGSGGAGGSIWVTAGTLAGTGRITADGASPVVGPPNPGGAGAGGRITIEATNVTFDRDGVSAFPGVAVAGREAGAGTIFWKVQGQPTLLVVDDGGRSNGFDDRALGEIASETPVVLGDLSVRGTSRLVLTAPLEARVVSLEDAAILSPLQTTLNFSSGLDLTAATLTVGPDAAVEADGRGYLGDCQPGMTCGPGAQAPVGIGGARSRSGGSHGGLGAGPSPNVTYGDPLAPTEAGAGGGYGAGGGEPGGDGGGRLRIQVDTLVVDGRISADGHDAALTAQLNGGGGAGGSVWITADTLSGGGLITANGGAGHAHPSTPAQNGINGGGGRIAIEYASSTLDPASIRAWPGDFTDGGRAAAGTVMLTGPGGATLVIDDGGLGGGDGRALGFDAAATTLSLDVDLVLRGTSRLALGQPLTVHDLTLEGQSVLTHLESTNAYEGGLTINADTLTIGRDAAIDVTGRGYGGDCTPGFSCGPGPGTLGNVTTGNAQRAGGSHGGAGGSPGGALAIYGDPFAPTTLGGGGGYGNGGGEPGGDGGGRVRIVADSVVIDGAIRADGAAAAEQANRDGGGGAGGSVWITAPSISGAGQISAIGGAAGSNDTALAGGGGGGGRIALDYTTLGVPLTRIDASGGVSPLVVRNGGPGTIRLAPSAGRARIVVDNRGRPHVNEVGPWPQVGRRSVATVVGNTIEVPTSVWLAHSLAGATATIGARSFAIVDNTANSLELEGSLAGVAIGDIVVGSADARGDLEIRGASRVSFDDVTHARTLLIEGDAVVTHTRAPGGGTPETGLDLTVDERVTIAADGAIDVSLRGYVGDCQPGYGCADGGDTWASASGARQFSGGSHGGLGGGASPGYTYGDPRAPTKLGAGGGYGNGGGEPGGSGGGRVKLTAAELVLDGSVLARGGAFDQANRNGGGGAGGSVWLTVSALSGGGAIDASGGDGLVDAGAGGGGGRVAIVWEGDTTFDVDAIEVHGGASVQAPGGPGTLYLDSDGVDRLVVDNNGAANKNETAPWPELGLRTVTAAQSDRVTVDGALVPEALVGLELVFGNGTQRHTVVSNTSDTIVLSTADGSVASTNGQAVRAYWAFAGRVELHGGAVVALTDRLDADALTITGGAVLTQARTIGGRPEPGLWVEISGTMAIDADGRIDVTGRGYLGDCAPGSACGGGAFTLGNGTGGARQLSGGSFGGLGGGPNPNPTYGDTVATWLLGAGGGYGNGGNEPGGNGGGRVRLIVGTLQLAGVIAADGLPGNGSFNSGGGAGGGVYITATTMTGVGSVSARGGNGVTSGGGGGGGRVHIDAQSGAGGTVVVDGGGSGDGSRLGGAGTVLRD